MKGKQMALIKVVHGNAKLDLLQNLMVIQYFHLPIFLYFMQMIADARLI